MNAEKLLQYAVNCLKRAQLGNLRGSVTFHFNDGVLVSTQTISNEKPPVEDTTHP